MSEGSSKKVPRVSKKFWKYLGGCLIALLLLFAGFVLFVVALMWLQPRVEEFLESRNVSFEQEKVKVSSEESLIIESVAKAQDSVVSIAVSRLQFSPESGLIDESSNIGTGFIVDEAGIIITNQHVVSSDSDYKVVTSSGDEYEVVEIVRDNINDLALLKINGKDLKAIELGSSDELKVGQMVIAIGTPFGRYSGTATSGIISGLNRTVSTGSSFLGGTSKQYEDVIQTDAAINPGNSGGPLLDSSGRVIGVNFATTAGADNISFALPVNLVKERLSEYRKYGKFLTPYLGVEYQMITETVAAQYDDVVAGALVVRVVADSPASQAGLKRADIITHFAGEEVVGSLVNLIQKYAVGDELELKVYRDGETLTLKVTLSDVE